MNTVESIVESYFRLCRSCLTIPDVKVRKGNNRQIDLLAYNLAQKESFHVEVSVTHCVGWCPTPEDLPKYYEKKFFGAAPKRSGKNTDHERGKSYEKRIFDTYNSFGMNEKEVIRIWVCWTFRQPDSLEETIDRYRIDKGLSEGKIQVLSFRDEIVPELQSKVAGANYEDDCLRTLSLLGQRDLQKVG